MEPTDLDMDLAQFLRATHAGHGPECRQYLAAAAYLYGRGEHN
ncbi:hypothetical protein [Nocardia farcinica]|nr:hypothetical protein [Nocardia farcinica]